MKCEDAAPEFPDAGVVISIIFVFIAGASDPSLVNPFTSKSAPGVFVAIPTLSWSASTKE